MNEEIVNLNELQFMVDKWIKEIGKGYFSELTNTAILMEEVGELARIIARKYGDQISKKNETQENLADELADVLWIVTCLANQTGVNLNQAILQNFEKKTKRDKNRFG
jgi:NTP pyrophosphatase (non-canonical NTP hydrolase)